MPGDGRAPAPIPSAQHIATRHWLVRHGRSPSARSQSPEDGTPPLLSLPPAPSPHPPLGPGGARVRGVWQGLGPASPGSWRAGLEEEVIRVGELSEIGACLFGFTGVPRTPSYVGKRDLQCFCFENLDSNSSVHLQTTPDPELELLEVTLRVQGRCI